MFEWCTLFELAAHKLRLLTKCCTYSSFVEITHQCSTATGCELYVLRSHCASFSMPEIKFEVLNCNNYELRLVMIELHHEKISSSRLD